MNSMKGASRSPRYTQQELLRVYLRSDFCGFVQKVFETVNPGVTFSRNWSTEAVSHALQKVASGATTRLIINIPPRNLKSICSSVALPVIHFLGDFALARMRVLLREGRLHCQRARERQLQSTPNIDQDGLGASADSQL